MTKKRNSNSVASGNLDDFPKLKALGLPGKIVILERENHDAYLIENGWRPVHHEGDFLGWRPPKGCDDRRVLSTQNAIKEQQDSETYYRANRS